MLMDTIYVSSSMAERIIEMRASLTDFEAGMASSADLSETLLRLYAVVPFAYAALRQHIELVMALALLMFELWRYFPKSLLMLVAIVQVLRILRRVILYFRHNNRIKEASGLAIYFPQVAMEFVRA